LVELRARKLNGASDRCLPWKTATGGAATWRELEARQQQKNVCAGEAGAA